MNRHRAAVRGDETERLSLPSQEGRDVGTWRALYRCVTPVLWARAVGLITAGVVHLSAGALEADGSNREDSDLIYGESARYR